MSHKITRQQAIERAPLLKAWGEGGKLQYRYNNEPWADCSEYGDILSDGAPNVQYRIKPTPTLRPWRPEEVPVGAWIKVKELKYFDGFLHIQMLLYMCPQGVTLSARNGTIECKLNELANIYEHSLDHGKTWLQCGVVE